MKVGITFGCYCPLHQGHMDVIMRAKKENDLTYVVVCGYDNEPRADSCGLQLDKRFRIISNFLSDDLIKVIKVNDTELGIDESMSDHNWKVWTKNVYSQITRDLESNNSSSHIDYMNADFIWYVSESNYVEALNKNLYLKTCDDTKTRKLFSMIYSEKVVLMERVNPISGTECRNNPLKNWSKITNPFRAYFSHNILIAGTASEGKTTLTRDIGKYFSIPYSYEKGRDICKLKTDKEFTVKDFIYNIYEQQKFNEELICSPQNPGVFISDTDNIVTLMYADAYKNREDFALNESDYQVLYDMTKVYRNTTKWDKIFLTAPKEKPIVDDGERYMEDSDYNIRVKFFEKLKSLYDEFGYEYEILTGNYYENFIKVSDYIKELYHG